MASSRAMLSPTGTHSRKVQMKKIRYNFYKTGAYHSYRGHNRHVRRFEREVRAQKRSILVVFTYISILSWRTLDLFHGQWRFHHHTRNYLQKQDLVQVFLAWPIARFHEHDHSPHQHHPQSNTKQLLAYQKWDLDYDAFVVLHGTDTMSFTASSLSFMIENLKKTIIITGSQGIFLSMQYQLERQEMTPSITCYAHLQWQDSITFQKFCFFLITHSCAETEPQKHQPHPSHHLTVPTTTPSELSALR